MRTARRHLLALVVTVVVTACGLPEAEPVLDADPSFVDVDGARGPFSVWKTTIASPSSAEVFFPGEAPDEPRPLAVVFQGGLVETARYHWLATHLASEGFVTVVPQHVLDLAFFQQWKWPRVLDEARRHSRDPESALAGLVDDDAPGIALGHSLGGVVAAKAWLASEADLATLVLMGSVPDENDANDARTTGRVVSITGAQDLRLTPDEVKAGAALFAAKTTVAVIDGMNHYQWTTHPSEGELETDGAPTVTDDTARTRALTLIDDALREVMGDAPRLLDDASAWPIGVTAP